ncbi:MAG TPA: hypothetical protein VG711_06960 [Phycisphaerales bacterium]|nr:hypothetical protein [Phycisphaerales bacterium]
MKCNIDSRGKAVRLIFGITLVVAACALILWDGGSGVPGIAATVMLVCGAVGIIEGWAGWCVVRAMGIKTPV